jgi:hypothetical protein
MKRATRRDARRDELAAESTEQRLVEEARQRRDRRIINYSARLLAMFREPPRRSRDEPSGHK